MPVRFNCPGCQAVYTLPDQSAGMKVRCRQCWMVFRVGKPRPEEESLDAAPSGDEHHVSAELTDEAPDAPTDHLAPSQSKRPALTSRPRVPQPAEPPPAPPRRSGVPFVIAGVLVVLLLLCGGGAAGV